MCAVQGMDIDEVLPEAREAPGSAGSSQLPAGADAGNDAALR